MKSIYYPSKGFKREAERLITASSDFKVIVPKSSPKKVIVTRRVSAVLEGTHDGYGFFQAMVNLFRLLDFDTTLAPTFVDERYNVNYQDEEDLVIEFKLRLVDPQDGNVPT